MKPIRVAIVDDDKELCEGLTYFLNQQKGFRCDKVFHSCEEALRHIKSLNPDIVLLDIGLPGLSGVECLRHMHSLAPRTQVIILTVFDDDENVFRSLVAGAHGYILKSTPPEKIVEAVREVHNGGAPMTGHIARRVLDLFAKLPIHAEIGVLSKREREILYLLVQGITHKEIAGKLLISPETVRVHLKNIYEKLHVHSKTEAVAKILMMKK